jgi:all-trans-retinol 13,14-reductase
MADVDVVVIGSGAGGLTAAVALARAGKSVLVVEQHYVPGGWCHSFQLGGYRFSPGVHYIGQLGPGGAMRRLFEGLDVAKNFSFFELNPDAYEHCIIGNDRFDYPKGREALASRLKARFPGEARGIDDFLKLTQRVSDELEKLGDGPEGVLGPLTLPFRAPALVRHGLRSFKSVLHARVKDPLLRAILAIQCGDHGLGPTRVPFVQQAAIMGHYFDGSYYPKGGGSAIPKALTRGLLAAKGKLQLRTSVDRILVEKHGRGFRAVGVKLGDGTEIRAKHVISNADPHVTYGKLLSAEHQSGSLKRKLRGTRYSISGISLFLALDVNLRTRGYDSGNYWATEPVSADQVYSTMASPEAIERQTPVGTFVSVSSLKDPTGHSHHDHSTIEAFTFVPYSPFAKFQGASPEDRKEGYDSLKRQLIAQMIRGVERVIPDASKHVVFADIGTPLTNDFYCRATEGNLYGTEKTLRQLGPWAFPVRTELEGLLMCGSSTLGHGVMGAASSGLVAAAAAMECRPAELLGKPTGEFKMYSAEDPSTWPSAWRERSRSSEAHPEREIQAVV